MYQGKIIAISGIMGSGKTTLCRNLAHKMGWTCLPEPMSAKKYLTDFFKDLDRYAYSTQIAFLCNKAIQIIQLLQSGKNLIIDRSIYEDIFIFAKCWYDRGNIDNRDFEIYSELANYFIEQIPAPMLILYCQCSLDEAKRRINLRDRVDQRNFPKNHIEDISERYERWINEYKISPVYQVDTQAYDTRTERVIVQIIREINEINYNHQITFFNNESNNSTQHSILKPIYLCDIINSDIIIKQKKEVENPIHPWAYIAAPFTSVASEKSAIEDNEQLLLSNFTQEHGKIEPGRYRRMLLSIEKRLNNLNIDALIPHRDINAWGDKILTPQEAAFNCAMSVKKCDIFIGILGNSSGSHYEYGIAEGKGKPSVIVLCDEISTSFIGRGLIDTDNRLILKCKKISDISNLFCSIEFIDFINKNLF